MASKGAKSVGAQEAKRVTTIRSDFRATYGSELKPLNLDEQEFRFTLIRPEVRDGNVPISDRLSEVTWTDEGTSINLNTIPVLRGTATWIADDDSQPDGPLLVRDGHRIRAEVRWVGKWQPLWEMRIIAPPEKTLSDGTTTATLSDDLVLASLSRGNFRYRKGKTTRKRGWKYHEIVKDVCEKYRIPIGNMVAGTEWIENLHLDDVSPLEVIRQAVAKEQTATGKRFLIAWRPVAHSGSLGGFRFCLNITHPTRNPILYTFRDEIRDATLSPVRWSKLATSIVATGSSKEKAGKRRKWSVRAQDPDAIRRFGYIERHIRVAGNMTKGKILREAKKQLAKYIAPRQVVTDFTHTGIAFVRRGDVVKLDLPEEGYSGTASYVFVTSVTHTLSGEDYTMSLDLSMVDPLDPNKIREELEKAERAKKRRERGKRT